MCEVFYIKLRTATAIGYRDWQYTTGTNKKKSITYIFTTGYEPDSG